MNTTNLYIDSIKQNFEGDSIGGQTKKRDRYSQPRLVDFEFQI
jgi:hypothetical protein